MNEAVASAAKVLKEPMNASSSMRRRIIGRRPPMTFVILSREVSCHERCSRSTIFCFQVLSHLSFCVGHTRRNDFNFSVVRDCVLLPHAAILCHPNYSANDAPAGHPLLTISIWAFHVVHGTLDIGTHHTLFVRYFQFMPTKRARFRLTEYALKRSVTHEINVQSLY
jgi:hypothetical protein